jgi:transposase
MMHLGNDLSKAYFDATLRKADASKVHRRFDNDAAGFSALAAWLHAQGVTVLHACMEATNIYWEGLAAFLHEQGYTVSVVNPARIKGFAISQLRRNKTDKLDSEVIADFCAKMEPKVWTPPSAEQHKLRSLVRHRDALQKTITQQKNRLASCNDSDVRASLQRIIESLQAEQQELEAQIKKFIAAQPALQEQQDLLCSIQGIGPVASTKLLAEMYDLATYDDAHAAAADAGLSPAQYESGDTVHHKPRLSKVGKASVRSVLYWPAITAIQHNPVVKKLAQRLEAKGKPKMLIIAAAMRKLIHLAFGVLKNKTPFDPAWGPKSAPST